MRLSHVLFVFVSVTIGGCAARQPVDVESLHGPLADVVKVNHLDGYASFPLMNLPFGEDQGATYFLNDGNLILRWYGNPPVLRNAEFWPSDKSAEQRYQETNAGWGKWVDAHSQFSRPKKP